MTGTNVINKVRPLINDTVATYRWSDLDLISKINDTLQELWRQRPTAFYLTSIITSVPAEITAAADTVPVTDTYRQAIVYFVCYLTFMEDTDDIGNTKRALSFYDLFLKEMA